MNHFDIHSERLLLTPLGPDFLQSVNEYALDYENTKYMFHLPNESSEETAAFLKGVEEEWAKENPESFEFAVIRQGRQIGAVSIYLEDGTGELGWIMNKKYWGNGFACEAAKALIDYFAEHFGVRHFIAHCDTENTASRRTMEKLGKVFNTVMYKSESDFINMVVIDVTEQKETEAKLSRAIEDANAAYKTQAEFLANMSHEIRTPINGILGMIQLTLMAEDLQADYRDNLITAKNCADNLLRLINDILDISKLEAGKYKIKEEITDIRAAIEETVAAHVPEANNKNISLDLNFGNNIPKLVRADGQRIQQVLNCLLSNAIKFTSDGGVRVKIAAIDDTAEKATLRIAVADTGIGISEANMSKLFIRFSQVDGSDTRRYGGSGLGLVISKQITELMGGTISVQSKEGIGSTFIAEIPIKVVKPAEVAKEAEEAEKEEAALYSINNANGKNARILVAEDEPVNQQVIGKLLGMAGFSYDIAENGEKAVELYKEKSYDAALFDVQMPIMDGIAATQEIRKIEAENRKPRLPIIAVTARAMFGDKERIMQNQLDDYIAKPYNLNTVVDTLNKYIDGDEDKKEK